MDEFFFDLNSWFVGHNPASPDQRGCGVSTRQRWCSIVVGSLIFVCLSQALARPVRAQIRDSFEGGGPRWQLVESDCTAEVSNQEITPASPHSGQTCESLEMYCANGTYAYLAMPVEPCAIIDELTPSVWIQCASSRIRLGVSVVFPNALHPSTGGRMHTILWGGTYDEPGQWQRLTVNN
ncbi:MAG: hypothetical protein IT423_18730 [Pirellulaceae bacterium]|nr:hypothetical protein [Pirellulaceae bacterium]